MNGTPPTGQVPNGGPRKFIQRHQTSDPLVRPKKRPQRAPLKKPAGTATNRNAPTSGHSLDNKASSPASRASPAKPSPSSTAAAAKNNNNGFSGPPPKGEYYDYDLVTTKKALLEGLRFHVARFASKKNVNPLNTDEFTRPVRLQRRDPRAPPTGGAGSKSAEPEDAPMTKEDLMDEKERERQEALKAEKEAQKQADLEQIAPRAHQPAAASSKKHSTFNKKTTQVYDHDQTPEARKRSQVRYEEALPWHLEDFDNKNAWVGNYESALSDMYVGLIGSPNKFRMVPMERWYKFTPKNHFKTLTIEEAESRMNKPVKEPRWLMEKRNAEGQKKLQDEANRRGGRSLFIGKWENERVSGTSRRVKADPDADDIDYEKVVSDDEEPPLMEGEEEVAKEAEKRIKKDQLQANVFDLKDEKEYEREDDEDKKQQELAKKLGKGVKKALIAREKNYIYDTDSDFDPDDEEVASGIAVFECERMLT
jgi:transcription initiation factor TFIIF subunit alpha